MHVYTLERTQVIPQTIEETFAFFANTGHIPAVGASAFRRNQHSPGVACHSPANRRQTRCAILTTVRLCRSYKRFHEMLWRFCGGQAGKREKCSSPTWFDKCLKIAYFPEKCRIGGQPSENPSLSVSFPPPSATLERTSELRKADSFVPVIGTIAGTNAESKGCLSRADFPSWVSVSHPTSARCRHLLLAGSDLPRSPAAPGIQ